MVRGLPVRGVVLSLFVVFLGMARGAGIYESQIEVPRWLVATADGLRWDGEAARQADTGRRFWAFVTTGPLTLLTLASLVLAWRSRGRLRRWWLVAAGASLVDRVATFGYFLPVMLDLMESPDGPDAVRRAEFWTSMTWGRHWLDLIALVAALVALVFLRESTTRAAAEPQAIATRG